MNPCITCGACCAFFRVEFYWREAESADRPNAVPEGMFEELTPNSRCMKGTGAKHHPKCVGLRGRIGQTVACSIYQSRPTPCRDFQFSYHNGKPNPRCDQARRAHGLPPLRREDVIRVE